MNRQERLTKLLDLVVEHKMLRVEDIVRELHISPATARRDLDYLATQQLVTRTRGGVMTNPTSGEMPMRFRTVRNNDQKSAIARLAVDLVHPGNVVALNGGTTTTAIGVELGQRVAADYSFGRRPVTVVTNAVNIANDLIVRPQIRVVVTGGVARARSYELVGPLASLIYPHINVDIAFLGAVGVSVPDGVFTDNESEAAANRALVAVARKAYVVVDSSKIGVGAFAKICALEQVSGVITDSDISSSDRQALAAAGVSVITD
ncbi:MAG: DeoR/GlpR family DNA-binding transcription regulator [Actinomycetaceae bacterium]|nr:DeoR/GlpR family DNA-binding transcription regulator [Actinomycetaceae bacterium]MDY5854229.1 DeoR/GlpR family DNA-binding transcription regulator [Arcanobacterium sp.]